MLMRQRSSFGQPCLYVFYVFTVVAKGISLDESSDRFAIPPGEAVYIGKVLIH